MRIEEENYLKLVLKKAAKKSGDAGKVFRSLRSFLLM